MSIPYNGTEGTDLYIGSSDDDIINGNGGNDQLDGQGGNDTINGGSGNDIITGGLGIDTLTGGTGADAFRDTMNGLNGDHITDLSIGDRIQVTDLASADFAISGDTITFGGDNSVTVDGLGAGRLITRPLQSGFEIRLQEAAQNDFNGDGRSDVLLQYNDGTAVIDWLGQSNGTFFSNHAAATYSLPTGWSIAGTGDFDGDGRVDLLLRNVNGTVTNWLGKADGTFFSNHVAASYALSTDWNVAGTGDFNADGHADVLLRNVDGTITEWLGQANGGFSWNSHASYGLSNTWHVADTGDFNGDGSSDVLLRNDDGTITEWLGQADGTFAWNANASYGLDNSWHVDGTGDFNGDATTDVLLRNNDGTVTEWLGQSDGTFAWNSGASYGLSTSWHVAQIGDFNGDTRDDILLRNDDGTVTEWLGQNNGTFNWNANATYALDTHWHVEPMLHAFPIGV